jgi:hypothetical protein
MAGAYSEFKNARRFAWSTADRFWYLTLTVAACPA